MQEYRALGQQLRVKLKDPLYAAFYSGIKTLVEGEEIEPEDKFNLICDDYEEYSGECLATYRRLIKQEPVIAEKIGGLCFLDDMKYAPLQAADLFAFCRRRHLVKPNEKGIWAEAWNIFLTRF